MVRTQRGQQPTGDAREKELMPNGLQIQGSKDEITNLDQRDDSSN